MGKQRGLGLHLIFACAFLVAGTYTSVLGRQNTSAVCSKQEQMALLKFKDNVNDSCGMLSSWVGNDCCVWEGILCDSLTGHVETLHIRGHQEALKESGGRLCYLSGNEVNSSLAELKHLKHLELSASYFDRIPEFIGSLKQLTYLNLSYADVRGNIPHHIGNLSNLKVLDLTSNSGLLMADDMAWASGLSSLEHLNLSGVDLGGARNRDMVFYMIPSLKELSLSGCRLSNADLPSFLNSSRILPNLKYLDLSFNSFKGPLSSFFQNLSSLAFLDLSYNNLGLSLNFASLLRMIPSLSELHLKSCELDKTHLSSRRLNFSSLSNIQHLDLSQNSIEGAFPSVLTNMSSLRVLDLSKNMLNSSLLIMPNLLDLDLSSNWFTQIGDVGIWRQCHLIRLDASDNPFVIDATDLPKNVSECSQYALEWLDLHESVNGTIPEYLGRLDSLRGLDLSGSGLTGVIPEYLEGLRYLEVLDLSDNQLSGPIPTFHGNLSKLDLSHNQLDGTIPESLGNQAALTYLDFSFNRLTGPILASLGRLVSLQTFHLNSNLLNGTIPVSLGQLAKLHTLELSSNFVEGVVSEAHFANLSMLKNLDTSYNTKLMFNVSRGWIPPFQLEALQLSDCKIANGFPQWLQNQRKLKFLGLSNTTISGPLPTWLRKMLIIYYLDLSHNNLNGPLTNLPNSPIEALLLEYNFFNGSIPRSFCSRTDLKQLDLSKNWLSGTLPKCIENLQGLLSITLSSNRFSGVIPSFRAPNLSILKLNRNNFVGELPLELGDLPYLSILDVGDNELCGNIPEWDGEKLEYLQFFRLRKNNFTGSIPRSLCKASNLHILDVAHNNLNGPIPRCLGELIGMVNGVGVGVVSDYYDRDDSVVQFIKGADLEYDDAWELVYNMDLSSNKLVGEIPVELTALFMLIGLNLSNNHLTGGIPHNIGNMANLESLDLSRNLLTGVIPPSMTDLTFLSHLNLSHNNLMGRIPTGRQLQTLIDPSIYEGNKDLCGPPLTSNCSKPQDPTTTTTTSKKKHKAADVLAKVWLFYVDVICGFATGFWGVIGVLLWKKQWRWKLFRFAEGMMDKIYVAVVVRVAKIKRGREAE